MWQLPTKLTSQTRISVRSWWRPQSLKFGRLDVLDNNIGIASLSAVTEETQGQWERVMQSQCRGDVPQRQACHSSDDRRAEMVARS